jgi:hypothetical protein
VQLEGAGACWMRRWVLSGCWANVESQQTSGGRLAATNSKKLVLPLLLRERHRRWALLFKEGKSLKVVG